MEEGLGSAFLLTPGAEMLRSERCSAPRCEQPGVATVESHFFCRAHFISTCLGHLEEYAKLREERRLGEISPESLRRFIHESARQADDIERAVRDMDNLERARLLDIIVLAAELGRHLRRSPRMVAAIPIRVRSKMPGERWEEETETRLISRYGALAKCRHSLEIDQVVRVIRIDDGRATDARVAWHQGESESSPGVGLEFLECENFWGMDWDTVETAR